MTEKRFSYCPFDGFEDNGKGLNPNEVLQLLNELAEENQRLHDEVFRLRTELAYDRTEKEKHSDTVYDFEKKLEKW